MTDIQAEINAKEKCQEQLNIIYQNAQILSGDTTKYQQSYLDELQKGIDDAWTQFSQIALSMLSYKDLVVPKTMDVTAMTDAGIIPIIDNPEITSAGITQSGA